jgi:hypothetical protein
VDHHQVRLERTQVVEVDAEPAQRRRAEVGHHDVRGRRQPPDQAGRLGVVQVDRDTALGAAEHRPGGRLPVHQRRVLTRRVAGRGVLDLDHVRAELGEQRGRQWTGQDRRHVQDTHTT